MATSAAGTEAPVGRDVGAEMQRAAKSVALSLLGTAAVVSLLLALSTDKQGGGKDYGVGITLFVLFAAAAAVGGILGFLFGLPRGRLTDELATPSGDGTAGQGGGGSLASAHYLASSNLNKVSDWLTTIVIGLGLVNLGNALPALRSLAAALEAPLGGAPYAGAIGIGVMICGLIGGFLVLYLYTTIRVRQLLEESERQSDDVPALQDLSLTEAQHIMSRKRLRLAVDSHADPRSRVTGQDPKPGRTVPAGTPVTVELAPPPGEGGAVVSGELVPPQHTPETQAPDPTQDGVHTVTP
jgi:PASTA domain